MVPSDKKHESSVADQLDNTMAWQAQFPRISLELPALVTGADGTRSKARVHALSLRGVQLLTDRPSARQMLPSGKPPRPDEDVDYLVQMMMPGEDHTVVSVHCRLRYVRIREGGKVLFVLKYRRFVGHGARDLAHFIESSMIPAA